MKAGARLFVLAVLLTAWLSLAAAAPAATITVTSTGDDTNAADGSVSLREAVASIDAGADTDGVTSTGTYPVNDTILFAAPVTGTITLTGGPLSITRSVTVTGPGAAALAVSANGASRVIDVASGMGGSVSLSGLTITGGSLNSASPLSGGAGIANQSGALSLSGMSVTGNSATLSGGGDRQGGGGVFNTGLALSISNSAISGNTLTVTSTGSSTGAWKGGAGVYSIGTALSIAGSTISGNTETVAGQTALGGSGVFNALNAGGASITASTISGNSATVTGAPWNMAGGAQTVGGGGVYDDAGGLTVSGSTVSGNSLTATGPNQAGGGGVFENGGALTLVNSTISGNTATVNSPAHSSNGGGGLYQNYASPTTLTNDTVSGNSANVPGGAFINNGAGTFTFKNTIVANNAAPSFAGCYANTGPFVSAGHNLDSADTCGFHSTGDIVGMDPLLGPLQVNGSGPPTRALGMGSPAVNAGDDSGCPAADERGLTRPQGDHCDIGAYEYPASAPAVVTGPATRVTDSSAIVHADANPDAASTTLHFDFGTTTAYGQSTGAEPVGFGNASVGFSQGVLGLPEGITIHYRAVATNGLGTTVGADQVFTTTAAAPGLGPGAGPGPGPAVLTPSVTGLTISPPAFAAAPSGPSAKTAKVRRRKPSGKKTGATVRYSLNEAATVTFTTRQSAPGRRGAGGACVKPTRSNRRARPCTRTLTPPGSFSSAGRAGVNSLHFTGRIGGRRLARGNYVLVATPSAAGRSGQSQRVSLRITG